MNISMRRGGWGRYGRMLGLMLLVNMLVLGTWSAEWSVTSGEGSQLTDISVSPERLDLRPGETGSLRVSTIPANVRLSRLEFESGNPEVARVVADGNFDGSPGSVVGQVTAVAPGETWIRVNVTGPPRVPGADGYMVSKYAAVHVGEGEEQEVIPDWVARRQRFASGDVAAMRRGDFPERAGEPYRDTMLIAGILGEVVVYSWCDATGSAVELPAELGGLIHVGDVLHVKSGGGAVVIGAGWGRVELGEDSVLMWQGPEPGTCSVELFWGEVLMHLDKNPLYGGNEHLVSAGFACHIRHTVLVMEERGDTATVKVLDGLVDVRHRRGGGAVSLEAGQQVVGNDETMGQVTGFSVEEEAGRWSEDIWRYLFESGPDPRPEPPDPGQTVEIRLNVGRTDYTVNGEPGQLDAPPFVSNGRTYVPVRFVGEAFGARADWIPKDGPTEQVFLIRDDMTVGMKMGYTTVAVLENGVERFVRGDAGPVIVNGRTFLPLRAAGEVFGADFDWGPRDSSTRWVTFTRES